MQENHAQWHMKRFSTRKVNAISGEKNKELTTMTDELINNIRGKEEENVNSMSEVDVNEFNFNAQNNYNPNWKKSVCS